ncbi:MAG: TRAP transporter small permease [Desulfohalobiaceae bacterium]|nr:TRAP transporter small permease [Desulfohalobiaceae bacterium]
MRYVLHNPPSWSMEISRFLFIWMVMLSAALVTREQSHIQITFIAEHLPGKLRLAWFTVLGVIMLLFCIVLIRQGWSILSFFMEEKSPALDIAMGWIYLAIPVGGALIFLYTLENTIDILRDRFKSDTNQGK